jgi:hypothetical protein
LPADVEPRQLQMAADEIRVVVHLQELDGAHDLVFKARKREPYACRIAEGRNIDVEAPWD